MKSEEVRNQRKQFLENKTIEELQEISQQDIVVPLDIEIAGIADEILKERLG